MNIEWLVSLSSRQFIVYNILMVLGMVQASHPDVVLITQVNQLALCTKMEIGIEGAEEYGVMEITVQ